MTFRTKADLVRALISSDHVVLDVGFWGQGTSVDHPQWVHALLKKQAKDVYGVDLVFDETRVKPLDHYQKTTAEQASFSVLFDVIFAGDLIEHLSNPGLFLERCKNLLKPGGSLILTTPNCFNLFNLAEKMTKYEPTVNADHTCYFNSKTLKVLLAKNGFEVERVDYLYQLDIEFKRSWKKKFLDLLYAFFGRFTDKYMETLVIVARVR